MKMLVSRGVLLCAGALLGVVKAENSEAELMMRQVSMRDVVEVQVDCRRVFEVRRSDGDPALTGFMYSAVGWDIGAADDGTRMVKITAVPGELADDGVFVPDGDGEQIVLSETTGRGTCDWEPSDAKHRVYQLTHIVRKGGSVDATGTLYGYLDFTHWDRRATLDDIKAALLNPATHAVDILQDAENPWQPIDFIQLVGVGIATDSALPQSIETSTGLEFSGHGALSFEYRLSGGTLSVAIDGREPEVIDVPTSGWVACTLAFVDPGEHSVVFTYTADGDGTTAALRHVRWKEDERFVSMRSARSDLRVDLREGPVRMPARMEHVLPFAYSSTNWIGNVQGTAAKVTVVQLSGTDPAVTNWTDEVSGSFKVLVDKSGEGEKVWHPKKGVWKATFDILGTSHSEEVWFDLRNAIAPGFMLMVF